MAAQVTKSDAASSLWSETNTDTYLVFRLNDGAYATRLLDIREVVEFKPPKPLPNTKPSFLGVINIRGEIVGLVDLSCHLGSTAAVSDRKSLLVVGTEGGAIAAVVNEVVCVAQIPPTSIDTNARGQRTDEAFRGVAKLGESLVTLLDLSRVIEERDIVTLKKQA